MREKRKTLDKKCDSLDLQKIRKSQLIRERGITLIALVVTIIILLILAGVTLNIALSDGGLFSKTKEAADDYKQAQTNEEGVITDIEKELNKYGSENPIPSNPTPSEGTQTTIQDAKSKDYTFENTTTVTDENGNKVVIPGKFKIASNSGDTVKDGIVVEDTKGNQFVWIPVSNVDGGKNPDSSDDEDNLVKIEEGKTIEITLGRYTFDEDDGTPTLMQNGSNQTNDIPIYDYFNESIVTERENGGVGAKNLEEFIQSVKDNHGYYIARYEAGQDNGTPVSKMGTVWNNVTQPNASTAARGMYKDGDAEAKYVESDLVNSYAWDTAIVYIQAMGSDNYANQDKSSNKTIENTGTTSDEECHIFDMAGNVREYTTEYSTGTKDEVESPCVVRGGNGNTSNNLTAVRLMNNTNEKYDNIGFRPLLYLLKQF